MIPKEHDNAASSRAEVGLPVDGLAVLEVAEEDHADQGVAGDQREHAHDDEEALRAT